jgi:aryl-alcohol dehydrogenase-like predicted oxidoreductase
MHSKRKAKLSLGSVQFGMPYGIANESGVPDDIELAAILQFARVHGVGGIDTAQAYGNAELRLGESGVRDFKITSKVLGTQSIREQLLESMRALQIPRLDTVLLHDEAALLGPNGSEIYDQLLDVRATGLVDHIGVSVYSSNVASELIQTYDLDVIQAPVNALDRRFIGDTFQKLMSSKGVMLQARSIFLQGLLIDKNASTRLPNHVDRLPLDMWFAWTEEQVNSSLAQALNFVLSLPQVDSVVLGVDSVTQLAQLVAAATTSYPQGCPEFPFSPELIDPRGW